MEEAGPRIFLTTFATTLAFALGRFSTMPTICWLCIYACLTITIDFIYLISFIVAVLVHCLVFKAEPQQFFFKNQVQKKYHEQKPRTLNWREGCYSNWWWQCWGAIQWGTEFQRQNRQGRQEESETLHRLCDRDLHWLVASQMHNGGGSCPILSVFQNKEWLTFQPILEPVVVNYNHVFYCIVLYLE